MPTPIIELEAIRGTDFSQIVTLADNHGAPVSTNNAQGVVYSQDARKGDYFSSKDKLQWYFFWNF